MKEKRTYSLTAKERKALRQAENNKKANKRQQTPKTQKPVSATDIREESERQMIAVQARSKRVTAIITAVICVAVVLILAALIAPAIAYAVNPYRGVGVIVARFNLSNGMVLEYEVQESEYDTAATNFIFLAESKYFDNTVFFDAQNGWLRFGGYEGQPSANYSSSDYARTKHHKDSKAFCEKFGALPNNLFDKVTDKFGYRLRADKNGTTARDLEKEGVLAFWYNNSATEFQLSYSPQPTNQIASLDSNGKQTMYEINATLVGRVLNEKTLENIKAIAATASPNIGMSSGYQWKPPAPDIMIDSVRVYNLDKSKWKNFDFLEYMKGNNSEGLRRYTQWIGVA